jgi:aspartyl-tRNA(Asn)/glutamyl-tRNA(Gln) amidotransferase subunit B
VAKSRTLGTSIPLEILARYEAVIGLEVHAQLQTATKAFCACSTRFGEAPNSNVCPVCLGLPGALPAFNRRALELATRASLALHATIHEHSRFARKNYFYPDLPKGYQISMYELPLATGGWLDIEMEGQRKRIGITRLHMEEDAAKGMHEGFPESDRFTYIDFNRSGVPLVEIVSEPDMRTPAEAHAYLTTLKQIMEYTEVSDCNMEEGSLRCDANVSVRLRGADEFGTKAEVKNLNSFRYLQRALEYEIERQIGTIETGGRVVQETRLWNAGEGRTEAMRSKELAHDYRYFPDPDLPPVSPVTAEFVGNVRKGMGELPDARRTRFERSIFRGKNPRDEGDRSAATFRDAADAIEMADAVGMEYGLSAYDAEVLTATRGLGDYYEAVVKAGAPAKPSANWIITELLRRLNEAGAEIADCRVTPRALAELVRLVEAGMVTAQSGKRAFAQMFETGKSAGEIVAAEGLAQIRDGDAIERVCREVIERSPENATKFRTGNENVLKFFVGQVMRETRGQANPQMVNDTLRRLLR